MPNNRAADNPKKGSGRRGRGRRAPLHALHEQRTLTETLTAAWSARGGARSRREGPVEGNGAAVGGVRRVCDSSSGSRPQGGRVLLFSTRHAAVHRVWQHSRETWPRVLAWWMEARLWCWVRGG